MGNLPVSGLITITVYTRGFAPRHWVCGIVEQQSGGLFDSNQLELLNPLGVNSSADVLISNLNVAPIQSTGWEAVSVSGVFDGVHRFHAKLNTRLHLRQHGHVSVGNTWNSVYQGRDGQVHVLSIEFKVSCRPHYRTLGAAILALSHRSYATVLLC